MKKPRMVLRKCQHSVREVCDHCQIPPGSPILRSPRKPRPCPICGPLGTQKDGYTLGHTATCTPELRALERAVRHDMAKFHGLPCSCRVCSVYRRWQRSKEGKP